MRSWLRPRSAQRTLEATPEQMAMTGAYGGSGYDPVDNAVGWKRAGAGKREVPQWTRDKAVAASIAAYRSNPMATAIIDTYTAFCVGDRGVSYTCTNDDVRRIVQEFWEDSRNRIGHIQDLELRSQLLWGEYAQEMLVGAGSGVVRFSPMDPMQIQSVQLDRGNPLWPGRLVLTSDMGEDGRELTIAQVSDTSRLREGEAMFWAPFKTLITDTRGTPFLMPILDWLDNYDQVLSNAMDRTALARYLVWDVEITGDQADVDAYVEARGGTHIPPSGSVEVHNESVKWTAQSAPSGILEDSQAASSILTLVAGGAGLAKTWLAEPDGANRATSLTMAEPVRRRVGAVQKLWLDQQTERLRFVVDRAVAAKRLPATVQAMDPKTGQPMEVPASQSVFVTGPEVAAADAQITAQVLLNLATGLDTMVTSGLLTVEAGAQAAQKAWEDFMGVPYRAELSRPDTNPDDLATHIDEQANGRNATVIPLAGAQEARGNARQLHDYWTRGEGLAKWADSPTPWTTLHGHLAKFMDPEEAKRTAAQWFHDVFHYWPGADLNRVDHGHAPRGHVVGPG